MLKPNSLISKLPLWLLRGTAVAVLSIAIFLGISGYKIVPNDAQAQCVAVPTVGLPVYACNKETCTSGGNCSRTYYLSTVTNTCGGGVPVGQLILP